MQLVNFELLSIVLKEIKHRHLSGCLNITKENQTTLIYFNQGSIYNSFATHKGIEGEFALFQLLGWKTGQLSWKANPEYPKYTTIDFEQASNFYNSIDILVERGILVKLGSQPLDLGFFSIMTNELQSKVDSRFWHQIIKANYCPYRDLPANSTNFKSLLRTFETSKRTGIIELDYHGFEEYYLVEKGQLIGAFHYDESNERFKPLAKTDFSLFKQADSRMGVFLIPIHEQTNTAPPALAPTAKPIMINPDVPTDKTIGMPDNLIYYQTTAEKAEAVSADPLDDNNPYDF